MAKSLEARRKVNQVLLAALVAACSLGLVGCLGAPAIAEERDDLDNDLTPSKLEHISAQMRSIAIAVEAYGVDYDDYPSTSGRVGSLALVRDRLVPEYIQELPQIDLFGAPYLYWSDGKSYVVISTGEDTTPDVDYARLMVGTAPEFERLICHGRIGHPREDMVFLDGQFCQWYMPTEEGS